MNGLVNHGNWAEVNIVTSWAHSSRGGHFHRHTTEVIFMISGKADVELTHCDLQEPGTRLTLAAGEGLEIFPQTVHTFYYLEDSTHLQLLDAKFDPTAPDLVSGI
jgi:dTDP-4-dehydrorhamnose 3,5-epimerase-like enzyme